MPSIPHIAFPPRMDGEQIVTVEQDSREEIAQCVLACLSTPLGSRIDAPGYGIPDESFLVQTPTPSAGPYLAAVEEAEPRAELLGSAQLDGLIRRIVLKEG